MEPHSDPEPRNESEPHSGPPDGAQALSKPAPAYPAPRRRHRLTKTVVSGLALMGVGGVAGAITSAATSANAATATSTTATGSSGAGVSSSGSTSSPAPPIGGQRAGAPPGGAALPLHGTVTAVGTSSVTIKTNTGTVTYAVGSSSTIEKSGKATLSDLSVGDNVAFSTVTTDGTVTIDQLVAGGMAGGCGPGGAMGAGHGAPPNGSTGPEGSSGSSNSSSSTTPSTSE